MLQPGDDIIASLRRAFRPGRVAEQLARVPPHLRSTPLVADPTWRPQCGMLAAFGKVLGMPVEPSQGQGQAAVEVARQQAVHRDRLFASNPSITVTMLAQAREVEPDHVRSWLRRESSDGRVVTVEHHGEVLVPTFQGSSDLSGVMG